MPKAAHVKIVTEFRTTDGEKYSSMEAAVKHQELVDLSMEVMQQARDLGLSIGPDELRALVEAKLITLTPKR